MKCTRCGRESTSSASRCQYCNTPFNAQKTGGRKNTDVHQGILITIIALIAVLAILGAVYAVGGFEVRRRGFSSGGGGGAVSVPSASHNPYPEQNKLPLGIYWDIACKTDFIELLPGKQVRYTTHYNLDDWSYNSEIRTFTGTYDYVLYDTGGDPELEDCIVFYLEGVSAPVYQLYNPWDLGISTPGTNFMYIGR